MSHFKERKEKNCLNCNAQVLGRFCHVCGQENIETKESVWHIVTHFFYDITHFDGKFFSTVKYLLYKPGVLTYEYMRGKRITYLHPIRMYVFTSAFFFLLFFTFISPYKEPEKKGVEGLKEELAISRIEQSRLKEMKGQTSNSVLTLAITKAIEKYDRKISLLNDSIHQMEINKKNNGNNGEDKEKFFSVIPQPGNPEAKAMIDSITKTDAIAKKDSLMNHLSINVSDDVFDFEFYKDEATYLAVQKELPLERQDGYLKRLLTLKLLHWHDQQNKGGEKAFETLKEKFKHSFPTLLFVSLPIFAFLLQILYIRRKKFYYADHAIFSIHVYCATFILLLLYYLFDAIETKIGWWIFYIIKVFLAIYMIYYTYKAMRYFYEQGRFKTLVKYIFLGIMTSFVMGFLLLLFFIISAYNS